jgi:heptosyltransferase II
VVQTILDNRLKSANTIFVRCPNWVGDIVMATPVFECLRRNFPKARMIAGVRGYARGIIEDSPWFDHIIACNDKDFRGFRKTIRQIRDIRPDAAIVLPNSTRSFLTAKLGRAKSIFGYKRDIRKFLITAGPNPIRTREGIRPMPMIDYYMEICRYLGLQVPERSKPMLFITPPLQEKGEALLAGYGVSPSDKVIGLNPGASFGASKCWPVEYFAALAERIQEEMSCKIMLFAGPGEEGIAQSIVDKSRAAIINTAPDRVDLALLKPLVRRCDLLVTNDTGPRQYAVAFDIPVVVLMGPTDPRYTASNLDQSRVLREDMDCAPCHKKICPIDHRCMRDLSPERVFQAVKELYNVHP